jgi:hypothetical protein
MGATIFIVDVGNRFIGRLRTLLSFHGFSTLSATSADEGLTIMGEFRKRIQLVVVGPNIAPESRVYTAIAKWKAAVKPRVIAACSDPARAAGIAADRVLAESASDEDWLASINALLGGSDQEPPRERKPSLRLVR